MTDPAEPGWYFQHKRRWPLDLAVLGAALLMTWTIATGSGHRRAVADLSATRAELQAHQPEAIADEANAALRWAAAASAIVPWSTLEPDVGDSDPSRLRAGDLHDPDHYYRADAPMRRWVTANATALADADAAARLPACAWKADWTRIPPQWPREASEARSLLPLLMERAALDAQAGRWDAVESGVRTLLTLADHIGEAPGSLALLIALTVDDRATEALQAALAAPGRGPDAATLTRLVGLVQEQTARVRDPRPALAFERDWPPVLMASLASGDLGPAATTFRGLRIDRIPAVLNPYAVLYRFDRAAWDRFHAVPPDQARHAQQTLIPYGRAGLHPVSGLAAPSLETLAQRGRDRGNRWRLLGVALTLERWSLAHGGAAPRDFTTAGLAATEVIDPWHPIAPLRLQPAPDGGLMLWSVGRNRRDDITQPPAIRSDGDDVLIHLPARRAP